MGLTGQNEISDDLRHMDAKEQAEAAFEVRSALEACSYALDSCIHRFRQLLTAVSSTRFRRMSKTVLNQWWTIGEDGTAA